MDGFLNPNEILKLLNLRDNMTACDFGCGSGGWVLPLAKILESGQVFAIDILEEPLSALRARAKLEKISNIRAIKADVEKGVKEIFGESCDLVLMTNLLFQCEDKKKVLEEAKRILRSGGRILVVDWKAEAGLGPKDKVNLPELKEICLQLNLRIEKQFDAGLYHFGLILLK